MKKIDTIFYVCLVFVSLLMVLPISTPAAGTTEVNSEPGAILSLREWQGAVERARGLQEKVISAAITDTTKSDMQPAHVIPISPEDSPKEILTKAAHVVPTSRQVAWQKQELIAFIVFGINTFTGEEWGSGLEDPDTFHPTALNAEQWVKTLKQAGFKTAILTVKHHDGFVLYPTRYTKHDVASSSWKNGNGDVVRAFVQAAHKHNLGVGFYVSPADLHEIKVPNGRYGNGSPKVRSKIPTLGPGDSRHPEKFYYYKVDDYNRYMLNMLYELITEYGPVTEIWFDGANPKPGVNQSYNYQAWFDLIRKLAPNAVIAVGGPDVRWVGNESGYARKTEWSVIPFVGDPSEGMRNMVVPPTETNIAELKQLKKADFLSWYPAEVDVSIRPGWFYHASEDDEVKTLEELMNIYYKSVGRNSVLLLNVPPNKKGRFASTDVKRLKAFGAKIRRIFDHNLARNATVTDGSSGTTAKKHSPGKVIDGKYQTYWKPAAEKATGTLIFRFDQPVTFNRVILQENITVGQRVSSFAIDSWNGSGWEQLATATTIGYKRILQTPAVTTKRVRLRLLDARATPTIANFGLFIDQSEYAD